MNSRIVVRILHVIFIFFLQSLLLGFLPELPNSIFFLHAIVKSDLLRVLAGLLDPFVIFLDGAGKFVKPSSLRLFELTQPLGRNTSTFDLLLLNLLDRGGGDLLRGGFARDRSR